MIKYEDLPEIFDTFKKKGYIMARYQTHFSWRLGECGSIFNLFVKGTTCPYLRKFGIVCPNSTVLFEPYYDKEKQEYVYSNTQLIDWLKEKTSYIDSVFEKVSQVQKKKRELEADFKENIFDENEIETIIEKNKNK